jgi:hypothetical protein
MERYYYQRRNAPFFDENTTAKTPRSAKDRQEDEDIQ